jgi:rhamnose transport system permease protein
MEKIMHKPLLPRVSLSYRLLSWEFFLLLITAAVFVINSLASPYFLDPWNLSVNVSKPTRTAVPSP